MFFKNPIFNKSEFITKFINKYRKLIFKKNLFIISQYLRALLLGGISLKS